MLAFAVLGILVFGCLGTPPAQNGGKNNETGCACTLEYNPVCGADGKTYGNACGAKCANITIAHTGVCEADKSCTDSDGGKDIFAKGSTEDNSGGSSDTCANSENVMEYYCEGSVAKSEQLGCPATHECEDGACIWKSGTLPPSQPPGSEPTCQDSDSGQDYYIAGTATKGPYAYNDECTELKSLKEFYCKDGMVQNVIHICDPGERCDQGKCVVAEKSCKDTDEGKDKYNKGTVTSGTIVNTVTRTDACADSDSVREYYCVGDDYQSEVEDCPDDHLCENGECREAECEDSDGGENTSEKGTVTKGSESETDSCSGSSVKEYFCDGNDIESETKACGSGFGCEDGECAPV
jgi:hypothetical protein